MKKSFMTRALATGLSLAMALSLSVADTSIASAAAKKASVTSMMKVSSKPVTEGKKVTTYMNSTAAKKYRIKSHTESATAKKYISVVMTSNRKGLTIEAKDGVLAQKNLTKKGVYTKINFAPATSVKEVKKAAATKYVNLKVVVNAKPEDKLTMNASVTGVKTITVEFNKAIADASKVKATVKKGTADRACKATVDGAKITLAMDAKLIKGTYTVSVEGVADTAMTADVTVEKDEELTSYKVSSVATMNRQQDVTKAATDSAIVTYEALNQYGERMSVSVPQISCTLGTVENPKASTANAAGSFEVNKIPAVMAVPGTKGTVVIVDRTNGVNATQEVTVSAAATPTTVEVAGVYNANTNKIEELQANANLNSGNYYILFTSKDQYENAFTNSNVFQAISSVSIAGGLTNVAVVTDNNNKAVVTTRTVDGKDYLAVQLRGLNGATAKAGTYNLTIVNQEKGMLLNNNYTVSEATIIKSVTISADKGLYVGSKEQELSYEIIDQNGNAVTSYSVLNNTSLIDFSNTYGTFKFIKKADGTAKLVYSADKEVLGSDGQRHNVIVPVGTDDKKSAIITETVKVNEMTSGNFMVQPLTFTVYEAKTAKSVSKLKNDTATSLALGQTLKISFGNIVYADQYGNEMSAGDAKLDTAAKYDAAAADKKVYWHIEQQPANGFSVAGRGEGNDADKLVFTAGSKNATATVYLKYGKAASTSDYDYKFSVVATDTKGIDASTLKIKSINGGKTYKVVDNKAIDFSGNTNQGNMSDIEVVGKIGGVDTIIPASQYVIKSLKDNNITYDEQTGANYVKKTTSKTATVVIQVTTQDASGNRTETELTGTFAISTDNEKIAKIEAVNTDVKDAGLSAVSGTALKADTLKTLFKYKDQYGVDYNYVVNTATAGAGDVLVTVDVSELASGTTANDCVIVGSGTSNVTVEFKQSGTYKISVKATMKDADGKVTSEKDCVVTITVS